MSNDDEQRAALWRDQQRRRVAFQTELWQSLAGDPAATQQLHDDWRAIELWLLERDEPVYDPDDDPFFDPLGISDSVNVGL